ncbi:MAG TPA: hypothetical protein VK841_17600 [Polyangiaceae bacterium]|nr:hypothetical protein [Polyangiaceae bacterium]
MNAPSTQIQIAFDRLLMPISQTRQTFILEDGSGNSLTPAIAYDPYTRVVTIVPPTPVLEGGQSYQLFIASPSGPKDPNGLRAIDGAPIDPTIKQPLIIPVPMTIPSGPTLPVIDYCTDIPAVFQHCAGSDCHIGSPPPPATGLLLDTPEDIQATACNRTAEGSNTGPSLGPNNVPIVTTFGIDMPIIDQNNADPANSWLMYKILLAKPIASVPAATSNYAVAWQPLTPDERARLANLVPGREMPFPSVPTQSPEMNQSALEDVDYETLSLWIAQGAKLEQCNP